METTIPVFRIVIAAPITVLALYTAITILVAPIGINTI